MATLTIRDFDDHLKAALRVRAAEHGRSMEAEVRAILQTVLVRRYSGLPIGSRIRSRFADVDATLDLPPRSEPPRTVEFDE